MRKTEIINFKFYYAFKAIHCALVLGFSLFPFVTSAGLIDAKFKLNKKLSSSQNDELSNEVSTLYKEFLAKSMYSRCRWFPSDSQYLKIASEKCGNTKGTLLAFSRFMTEPDADKISAGLVNDHGHIRFLDFENTCDIF